MNKRRVGLLIWVIKAADEEIISQCFKKHLKGIFFHRGFTPNNAQCLVTASCLFKFMEDSESIIVMSNRFDGVATEQMESKNPAEVISMIKTLTSGTIADWKNSAPIGFEGILDKVKKGLLRTVAELTRDGMAKKSSNLLIITSGDLPFLESLAIEQDPEMKLMKPGEVMTLRVEVVMEGKNSELKVHYVQHLTL